MKKVIDTNVLIRFLLRDVEFQYIKAAKLINKARLSNKRVVIFQIVIFEVVFILQKYYEKPKDEIIPILKSLLSAEYFEIESRYVFKMSLEIFKKNNLSFSDCFIFSKAEIEKYKLITFDKKLAKLTN